MNDDNDDSLVQITPANYKIYSGPTNIKTANDILHSYCYYEEYSLTLDKTNWFDTRRATSLFPQVKKWKVTILDFRRVYFGVGKHSYRRIFAVANPAALGELMGVVKSYCQCSRCVGTLNIIKYFNAGCLKRDVMDKEVLHATLRYMNNVSCVKYNLNSDTNMWWDHQPYVYIDMTKEKQNEVLDTFAWYVKEGGVNYEHFLQQLVQDENDIYVLNYVHSVRPIETAWKMVMVHFYNDDEQVTYLCASTTLT
jgi:hypothetical protein